MSEKYIKHSFLTRTLLTIAGGKVIREMKKLSKNCRKASDNTLRHILTTSKDTVYGREYHFEEILKAKTPEELAELYHKYVPINEYKDLLPYIERHKNGEPDILFPGKPFMYATTSGTTKEPKWIPITTEYHKLVYGKMSLGWFWTLINNKPKVFYRPGISIVGKKIEGKAPDGTIYGSISGVTFQDIPKFMRKLHTAPADVFDIPDYKSRYYTIMRMGIERDTHIILTANPSTLVEMQSYANEYLDEFCEDIRNGTLSAKYPIPAEIRKVLEARLKPNPKRADELLKLRERYKTLLPKHYWPNLQIVNVWFCGNAKIYYNKVRDSYPSCTVFHEFGYFATECRAGLVLKSNCPDTTLFCHKSHFEFVHESDFDSVNPKIYQAWELKPGKRYKMVVTTCAGLYRYDMHDLIEVTGFYNEFPKINFIHKLNGTINITGEKLHEDQFIEAVRAAEKSTGLAAPFFVGFAELHKSSYKYYYEFENQNVSMDDAKKFTAQVDLFLKEYNPEYKDKRGTDRLKEPETAILAAKAFERFKAACIDRGYRDGQFKFNLLMQDEMRHSLFKEIVKTV